MPSPTTYDVILRTFIAWTALSMLLGAIFGTLMYKYDKRKPQTPPFPWERRD